MSRREARGGELPLIAWADERRRSMLAARRRLRRWAAFVAPIVAVVSLAIALPPRPRLVWNASASAPIGLYAVAPGRVPGRGAMVIARMPARVRALANQRRYVPANVPLVKQVGGVPGDTICANGPTISIGGKPAAIRRARDGAGRAMPWWSGCRTLRSGEFLLLSRAAPASFDGRYFGVSASADIIGTARLLWAR